MTENAPTPERVTLAAHEASHLVGDDIAFWVGNGFMSRDDLLGKVCWWVTRAAASREAEVRAQVRADIKDHSWHVANNHQFLGTKCLCGFESPVNRARTEHILAALAARIAGGDQ